MPAHARLVPCAFFACLLISSSLFSPTTLQAAAEPPTPEDQAEEKTLATIEFLVASKSYEKAENVLQSAIAQGTPAASAYFRVGKIYFDHDEWQRAADYLEKSVEVREGNDQAHLLLGLTYRELKQPERAEKEFVRAVELNPGSDLNAYFAGHQLLIDMRFEAALPYLYKAVKLNPRNASAYRALGMTQVHLGNYGLAELYYRKAVDAIGDSGSAEPSPFLDLAFILLLGHDPAKAQEALKLAQQAAKLEPNSCNAHYLVGKALMKVGRTEEAVPELERAAKLNPADSKPHFQLALAYDQLGQKEKAKAERQALAETKQRANQQGMASGSVMPQTVQ